MNKIVGVAFSILKHFFFLINITTLLYKIFMFEIFLVAGVWFSFCFVSHLKLISTITYLYSKIQIKWSNVDFSAHIYLQKMFVQTFSHHPIIGLRYYFNQRKHNMAYGIRLHKESFHPLLWLYISKFVSFVWC